MEPRAYTGEHFTLLDVERAGGMSRICKARLNETGDTCALKYPKRDSHEAAVSMSFNRELSALADMEHKNIVRLVGIGSDGAERFIVLEWLEETLHEKLKALGGVDWTTFYEQIGRPLLDALIYAHARGYAHRDLKPMNVMFNKQSVPKITDFGIARGISDVRLGVTFAAAGSHPWTPVEPDDGMFSERRDLHSWAAICVACLTGRLDFTNVGELRAAVDKLEGVAPRAVLRTCFSDTPSDRPASATSLLWDADDFHRARLDKVEFRRLIGIEILASAHTKLGDLLPSETDPDRRVKRLFDDFSAPCEVSRLMEGDLEFAGSTFCIRAGRGSAESPWAIVKDIRAASVTPAIEPCVRATIQFAERAAAQDIATQSRANLGFLEDFLRATEERQQDEQRRKDEERYLLMLQDVLAAKMRALRDLPALHYRDGKWQGGEFTVVLDGDEAPETGVQRVIRAAGAIYVFEVSRVFRDRVFLRPVGQRRGQLPFEGELQVDTVAQRRALERQDEAVKTLRSGLAVLPALKRLILKPELAEPPESGGRPAPPGLSPDKLHVLDAALGLRQLMVVQGPPGTGKTTLITEIVKQYLNENPGARVLIAAQTHIAIDHVIGKLILLPEIANRIVRIARADDDKVAENVRASLLQRCLMRWCETAAAKSRQFVHERGIKVGFNSADVERFVRLQSLLLACERQRTVNELLSAGQRELDAAQTSISSAPAQDVAEVETATVATMTVAELEDERKRLFDHVSEMRDELRHMGKDGAALSDLSEPELREWMTVLEQTDDAWRKFRHELELQVAWLDLLGQLKQFEEIVLRSASVVAGTCVGLGSSDAFLRTRFDLCIIDEASKATATEALIPMVRSERCLVVGDPKQLPPFEGAPIDIDGYGVDEVKETLLDYLTPRLPSQCVYKLTHQHRMCESIGALVSSVFYGGTLVNERPDSSRPGWMRKKFPKPVVWFDTRGSKQWRQGHTYVNLGEQDVILDALKILQHGAGRAKAPTSVAVIAGYAAQAYALDSRIQRDSFGSLTIDVATVDSFQGKETDVCIFSVTLSNTADFMGFLRSMKRLNVALSRPRDLLLIVGDQNFCYQTTGDNPFVSVIDYIDANRGQCETRDASR